MNWIDVIQAMDEKTRSHLSIRIPTNLHTALRRQSFERHQSVTSIIIEILEKEIGCGS